MGFWRRSKKGPYSGRLCWDHDLSFHTDLEGNKVVTEDGGVTWRYATKRDTSHVARYHQNYVTFAGTTAEYPHHAAPTHDDLHVQGVLFDPDEIAEKATGHTESAPHE